MMRDAVVLQKSDISFAITASYAISVSWIYELFAPSTPVIIVAQPDQSGQPIIKNVLPNWVMTVPFLPNGRGCQHMKVGLLVQQILKPSADFIAPSSCS
jgi:tyrosyl-DNA phosphodiesterase-1